MLPVLFMPRLLHLLDELIPERIVGETTGDVGEWIFSWRYRSVRAAVFRRQLHYRYSVLYSFQRFHTFSISFDVAVVPPANSLPRPAYVSSRVCGRDGGDMCQ